MASITLMVLLGMACYCVALECYTGFKLIAGRSIGTSKITCSSPNDYCYNATADISQLNKPTAAGCSTTRCSVSQNKCINYKLDGKEMKFCCCNSGNLCNSKYTNLTLYEKVKQRISDIGKAVG